MPNRFQCFVEGWKAVAFFIQIQFSYGTRIQRELVRAAKTIEEATELISVGFRYVAEVEGFRLFKKRK